MLTDWRLNIFLGQATISRQGGTKIVVDAAMNPRRVRTPGDRHPSSSPCLSPRPQGESRKGAIARRIRAPYPRFLERGAEGTSSLTFGSILWSTMSTNTTPNSRPKQPTSSGQTDPIASLPQAASSTSTFNLSPPWRPELSGKVEDVASQASLLEKPPPEPLAQCPLHQEAQQGASL